MFDHEVEKVIKGNRFIFLYDMDYVNELYERQISTSKSIFNSHFSCDNFYPYVQELNEVIQLGYDSCS